MSEVITRMAIINRGGDKPINLTQVTATETMQKSQNVLIYGTPMSATAVDKFSYRTL